LNRLLAVVLLVIVGAGTGFLAGSLASPAVFRSPVFISSVGYSSAPVAVPDVVGLSRQDARRVIESGSLLLAGEWSEYGEFETMGLVTRQDPPPGTDVPRGAPVNVFWNVGPLYRPYHPGQLVGLTAGDAEELVADWQLYNGGRTRVPHPTIPEGRVISVSPWFPDSLSVRRTVRLLVSTGWTGLPVLTGFSITEADSLLSARGVVLVVNEERVVMEPERIGRIIEQSPPGGSTFGYGDTVRVVLGRSGSSWGTW
jgi:serine/threonine-protein kinase